jgi:glycosyltransferase involved in cell wall biosynthesis
MNKLRVSVLVNTYNHERFIAQAIQSALDQDFPAAQMEIIVVDDGSTDATPQAIQPFLPKIRYIRKQNGGQISAFNVAVAEARGEIFAFLDGDDWWATGKLRAVLDVFEREPDTTAVGHGFVRVHERTNIHEPVVPAEAYRLTLANPDAARFTYSARPFFSTSKLSVRRNALGKLTPLPENLVFFDVPVHLLAIASGAGVVLNQPLCFYRLHEKNLYEVGTVDPENLRRRYKYASAQLDFLPEALAEAGISRETILAFLEPDKIAREQSRLLLDGGRPWETFDLERRRFRLSYASHGSSYALFKSLVLASTLLMSPRRFYALRDWYAQHNLRRFRKAFGEPIPIPSIRVQ